MSRTVASSQRSVRVENLHPNTTTADIEDFFRSKIGNVVEVHEHIIASTLQRWIEVTFESDEAAKNAISLSGQSLHSMPIHVGLLFDPDLLADASQKTAPTPAVDETRRNLYVLGLPHDFTLDDFKALFQPFGSIEHAVILAVLDNFSRRRGFVVFSTHTQARSAMRAIHKTNVKGHQLNVSWAVVQRSSGFLDGADRVDSFVEPAAAMKRQNRNSQIVNPLKGATFSAISPIPPQSLSSMSSHEEQKDSYSPRNLDFTFGNFGTAFASTLLVSNLCPWLFQNHIDIHALFAPYGFVKRITVIPPALNPALPKDQQPHAALVEYDDLQNALSALYQVNGRPFGTCIARASLFRDAMQRAMLVQNAPSLVMGGTTNAGYSGPNQLLPDNVKSPIMQKPTEFSPHVPRLNVH